MMAGNRKPPVISSRGRGAHPARPRAAEQAPASAGTTPAAADESVVEAAETKPEKARKVFSATKEVDPEQAPAKGRKAAKDRKAAQDRAAQDRAARETVREKGAGGKERFPKFAFPGRKRRAAEEPEDPDGDTGNVLAFPEPPGRRRRRIALITAGSVLAVVAALIAVLVFSPLLAVKTITVDGLKLANPDQVNSALAPLKDKPLPQVDAGQVQKLLSPLPQVHYSTIEARPPSTLLVHVTERVPVALLKNGDTFVLVDQEGVQVASTKDRSSVPLPLIDGGTAAIGQDIFKAITAVLAVLPTDILAQLDHAQADSVDSVQLRLNDGKTVVWGNAGEKELKAKVLQALLKASADAKPGTVPVRVYDVSAPRDPVTR